MDGIRCNVTGMERLSLDLLRTEALLKVRTAEAVHVNGGVVFAAARAEAARHSISIPPSLSLVPRGPKRLELTTSVALGVIYERGNRGSSQDDLTFQHPVYGDQASVVTQQRFPFVKAAQRHTLGVTETLMSEAAEKAIHEGLM
jgi:hypothetical protein